MRSPDLRPLVHFALNFLVYQCAKPPPFSSLVIVQSTFEFDPLLLDAPDDAFTLTPPDVDGQDEEEPA